MRWLLPLALAAAAPLAAQQGGCTYTPGQGAFMLPGASGTGAFNVTVAATGGYTCTWSISTTTPWIHIESLTITGTGSISFTVDANNSTVMRQGAIVFSAPNVSATPATTVYQLAGTCTWVLSPTAAEIPVGGGNGALQVTSGCTWTASSNQGWLTYTLDPGNMVASGINYSNGNVNYSASANTCVASRSAILTVMTGVTGIQPALAITQDGSPGNLTLSSTTLSTGPGAATGRITVTTGGNCPWSAVSNANWLQITGSASGSGFGSFAYSVLANTGPARSASIQVGPQTFTVNQQAALPPTPQVAALVNGASYASGAVSPGEIVALFGANLGPAQGVPFQLSADGKSIPNTLAGVAVLFDSAPATLLYVSAGQINAIVPYAVAGQAGTAVEVQYQGQTSSPITLPVQAATPGIFSQDRTGLGPGAILNQDFSLNASLSRATVGSVIQIFTTGGGVTSPAQTDGYLAPVAEPFPRLTAQPVVVTIGGLAAAVQYAGAAPGLVAGLTQINAQVPVGVTPGLTVPVVVQIGSWQSQAGLTVAVQ